VLYGLAEEAGGAFSDNGSVRWTQEFVGSSLQVSVKMSLSYKRSMKDLEAALEVEWQQIAEVRVYPPPFP